MAKKETKKVTKKEVKKEVKKAPAKPKADPKVEAERTALIQKLTEEPYEQAVADLTNLSLDALKELQSKLDKEQDAKKKPKKEKKAVVEFASMCGSPFDPSPKSTCMKTCTKDYPAEFKKCEDHFKTHFKEKKSGEKVFKSKRKMFGKDFLGWGRGTSASMINLLLIDGHTIKEMAEHIGCPETRVRTHWQHLRTHFPHLDLNVDKATGEHRIGNQEVLNNLTIGDI